MSHYRSNPDAHRRKRFAVGMGGPGSTTSSSGTSSASSTQTSSSSTSVKQTTSTTTSTTSAATNTSTASTTSSSATSATTTTSSITSTSATVAKSSSSTTSTTSITTATTSTTASYLSVISSSSTSTSATASNTSIASNASSSTHTTVLVVAIGGSILGVAILAFLIRFIISHYRQRASEAEAFDAAQFRRSALILDDEMIDTPVTAARHGGRSPRPPTMIERHVAHNNGPSVPPGAYGAYPYAYGQGYDQQSQGYDQPPQQVSFTPGHVYNPISPTSPDQHVGVAGGYVSRQPSPIPAERQATDYMDMNRESTGPAAETPQYIQANVSTNHQQTAQRPQTLYDADDAYGGM